MLTNLLSGFEGGVTGWIALLIWILVFILVVVGLTGPSNFPSVLTGIGRLLILLFTGPVRFLQTVTDRLISDEGSSPDNQQRGSFLLVRVGRLLYAGILLGTVTILTGGLNATIEASFPKQLREWRSEAQEERQVLRENLSRAEQRLDSLEMLLGNPDQVALNRQQLNEDLNRLQRANQQGFDLRQRPGFWDALVEDFYREAWRTYTDNRDNLFPSPDRLATHRAAIEQWEQRIQLLLDESQIAQENVEAARANAPQIVEYGLGRLAKMDSLAAVGRDLRDLNNLDQTLQDQRMQVNRLTTSIEDLSLLISENGLFSTVFNGFPVIFLFFLLALLWIWGAGVAVESLMLVVGINRDIRSIRDRLDSPQAQTE